MHALVQRTVLVVLWMVMMMIIMMVACRYKTCLWLKVFECICHAWLCKCSLQARAFYALVPYFYVIKYNLYIYFPIYK